MKSDMQDLQGALQEREELTVEGQRLLRIRKQMREQDKKRFRHPDAGKPQIQICYVWREQQWIPITWFRGNATHHKLRWLRKRYKRRRSRATRGKIGRKDVLRVVELRIARFLGGAGGPPLGPFKDKTGGGGTKPAIQGINVLKRAARGQKRGANPRGARLSQTGGTLGRCDYQQCKHRAFWIVCYMDDKKQFGKRKTVRKRCTKHAWKEEFFPATARHFFRIQRKPRKVQKPQRKSRKMRMAA